MEQTISKTALIVGATGLIGNQLLDLILGNENYEEVRVLVRKPLGRQHPRLVEIVYDFDKPTKEAVTAADIFCCLGTTMKKAGSKEAFLQWITNTPCKLPDYPWKMAQNVI